MRNSPFLAMIAVVAAITTLLPSHAFAAVPVQNSDPPPVKATTQMDGASTWTIDNEHSSVVGAVSHFGLSFIYGRFNNCEGSIRMDFQQPDSTKFQFKIDPGSIDSNNPSRDIFLRGPNCLDASQYDSINFESISVKAVDQEADTGKTKRTFQITGNLTIHGETRKVTIPLELLAMGNGPNGKLRCGFMSKFVVQRSEFGINGLEDSVGDSIAVTFCFQAVHQQPKSVETPNRLELGNETREPEVGLEVDSEKEAERKRLEALFRPKEDDSDSDEISADKN